MQKLERESEVNNVDNETMKQDFAASVRACQSYARPWKLATAILSLAVVVLAIVAVLK